MALPTILGDPCDGSLEILDRDGHPIVIPDGVVFFHIGGIVPQSPGVLAYQSPDYVVSRRQAEAMKSWYSGAPTPTSEGPIILETRWMPPPSYEERLEVDRVLARRDRERLETASKITSETES